MPSSARSTYARRILGVVGWFAFGLCAFYALFGGEYPIQDLVALQRRHHALISDSVRLTSTVDSLRHLRDLLRSDSATIERVARERFGFIASNEILYRFVRDGAAGQPDLVSTNVRQ